MKTILILIIILSTIFLGIGCCGPAGSDCSNRNCCSAYDCQDHRCASIKGCTSEHIPCPGTSKCCPTEDGEGICTPLLQPC